MYVTMTILCFIQLGVGRPVITAVHAWDRTAASVQLVTQAISASVVSDSRFRSSTETLVDHTRTALAKEPEDTDKLNTKPSPAPPVGVIWVMMIVWRIRGNKFQRVSRLGSVTARQSSSERQPNFAALNRGRHLSSAGRPSRWALAHILVLYFVFCC